MSLTRITTVHCDSCGEWEYTGSDLGSTRARRITAERKKQGWVQVGTGRERSDYCPSCYANKQDDMEGKP